MPATDPHLGSEGTISHQHRVRERAGVLERARQPHIGTPSVEGEVERMEYEMLDGGCRAREVVGYLDTLADKARAEGKPCVVVLLDDAPFHRAEILQEELAKWGSKGLRLYYLPAYCPHLKPHL